MLIVEANFTRIGEALNEARLLASKDAYQTYVIVQDVITQGYAVITIGESAILEFFRYEKKLVINQEWEKQDDGKFLPFKKNGKIKVWLYGKLVKKNRENS